MPEILSPADAARRHALVRMKAVASALLALMAVVFVLSWVWQDDYPWLGYVRAAAEAGMVGALADWFAVTALFRRPLGLPIPHTAIIPRRKEAIGSALSEFVATNFVSEEVLRDKLSHFSVADRLGAWLAEPQHAERVGAEAGRAVQSLVMVLSDERIAELAADLVRRSVQRAQVGPTVGAVMEETLARGDHRPLVDFVIDRAFAWFHDHRDTVVAVVAGRAPAWSPRFVDSMVGDRVYREVMTFAMAVKTDERHPVRLALEAFLAGLARDLQVDPVVMAKADRVAQRIVENEQVHVLVAGAWEGVKTSVLAAASDPSSPLRTALTRGLVTFGSRLRSDRALAQRIDGWVADAAGYFAANHARSLTSIIDDTIARWDGPRTARTIERHIGRDLQFIRINGTVVGALAGLAIYSVAQWVLG